VKAGCAAALGLAALGWVVTAAADPSVWARARDPALGRETTVLRAVEGLLGDAGRIGETDPLAPMARGLYLRDALARLRGVDAGRSRNPVLRLRYGQVTYGLWEVAHEPGLLDTAAEALSFAAHSDASSSIRSEAWNDLAICLARLGRFDQEIAAYGEALRIEPHAEARAVLLANRAEGFMLQGKITAAVVGYRAALGTTPAYALFRYGVTTWWGLAVALDRSGDLDGALEQIRIARSYDANDEELTKPTWFFLPDYDRYWYAALGHWLDARSAANRAERLAAFDRTVESWAAYLAAAPASDPWVAVASRRHEECRRERSRALARADEDQGPRRREDNAPGY
jgi:tetratricopeptide (TPR) repeat protein